jgi:hypothetical protein
MPDVDLTLPMRTDVINSALFSPTMTDQSKREDPEKHSLLICYIFAQNWITQQKGITDEELES